jgi:hypothetical protein
VALTADLDGKVSLRDRENQVVGEWTPPLAPVALALSALGDHAFAALTDGQVACLTTGWKGK